MLSRRELCRRRNRSAMVPLNSESAPQRAVDKRLFTLQLWPRLAATAVQQHRPQRER